MKMRVYLVGGAVRDKLMDLVPKDLDYVVTGSSEEEMLSLGYEKVGADFPVFLHPVTREEYALARRERKTGPGYTGFECEFDASVTIEEDLSRRDLTINAMAVDLLTDELIDPYGGKADLDAKILRHVSDAFSEDPVRVLRLARFAARYHKFTVAPETIAECLDIVNSEDFKEIKPDRIWKEVYKALDEKYAHLFFYVLEGFDWTQHPYINSIFSNFDYRCLGVLCLNRDGYRKFEKNVMLAAFLDQSNYKKDLKFVESELMHLWSIVPSVKSTFHPEMKDRSFIEFIIENRMLQDTYRTSNIIDLVECLGRLSPFVSFNSHLYLYKIVKEMRQVSIGEIPSDVKGKDIREWVINRYNDLLKGFVC